jgi:acylpyruvate hydrolase
MRFTTAMEGGRPTLGAVADGIWFSLGTGLRTALESGVDLRALSETARRSGQGVPVPALRYAPAVPDPVSTICLGLNYRDHAKEGGRVEPAYPWFFLRSARSLIAHEAPIQLPRTSSQLDFEAELAVIIGRTVPRHVHVNDALGYVFGYSLFNDVSVRDFQRRTPQWTIGKNFDATGAFGPVIVTADELPAGAKGLRIRGRLNGETVQDANTDDMIFPVDHTIALLAECMTLGAGDVLVMGTPSGVGQSRQPPLWLRAGDRFEVDIERIGTLSNTVRAE